MRPENRSPRGPKWPGHAVTGKQAGLPLCGRGCPCRLARTFATYDQSANADRCPHALRSLDAGCAFAILAALASNAGSTARAAPP